MPTLVDAPRSNYFQQFQGQSENRVLVAGRPKGRRSERGVRIREAIEKVFSGLGGWDAMLAWAKDNPDAFYGQVVPKLLPHELAESGLSGQIQVFVYGQPIVNPKHPNPQPIIEVQPVATCQKHVATTVQPVDSI